MSELSVISLNIELDIHLPEVIAFINARQPDVVLLQEVYKKDVQLLEKVLHMQGIYSANTYLHHQGLTQELGIMTCSKWPISNVNIFYYRGEPAQLPTIVMSEGERSARALILVEVVKDNQKYCLANTHFTWSAEGKPSALQFQDCKYMLELLSKVPEIILCGDFNAPRGTEIFTLLSEKYKDNIPSDVQSTLDKNLHRAGDLHLVVDGLFTSKGYQASKVEIVPNISDHCAVVGTICHV